MNHINAMDNVVFNDFRRNNIIAGFGNPLLDVSTIIKDDSILKKYNLEPDGQKEVDKDTFSDILVSLKKNNCDLSLSPGGCAQNTLRIVQTLVKQPFFCVFFGGLGNDEEGDLLETEVVKSGLEVRYTKHPSYPTGRVIALLNGENRSLVAHLGAAEHYTSKDFKTFENLRVLEEVYIAYIEGFFLTHSYDVALEASLLCQINGVVVVLNISGEYVAEKNPQELLTLVSAADIVVGNVGEFKALAKVMDLTVNGIEDLALKVHSSLWENDSLPNFKLSQMNNLSKSVIITQGKESVISVYRDQQLVRFEVPFLDPKLLKDTTGAGDSFAAGFLVAFLQDRSMIDCLAFGCEIARDVIQSTGVQFTLKS